MPGVFVLDVGQTARLIRRYITKTIVQKTPREGFDMARVALVTGGTRGIGAAISKGLKAAGYTVAATYAGNDAAAEKFNAETGIPAYKCDVRSFDACAAENAAASSASPRSTARRASSARSIIRRRKPATSASPRRWRWRTPRAASPST